MPDYISNNGRSIKLENCDAFAEVISKKWVPFAVLLEANHFHKVYTKELIEASIKAGTVNFVCVGDIAEEIHDFLDDVIVENEEFLESNRITVLTTYFSRSDIEEAMHYFLYLTEIPDNVDGGLLALVGGDKQLKEAIKTA